MTKSIETNDSSPLFLGLDLSTQAFKASLLTSNLKVLSELEIRFDQHDTLSKFGTKGGIIPDTKKEWDEGVVVAPVMLYVEALDLLMDLMKENGWELERVRGVSAAGQQHASVYWSKNSTKILSSLSSKKSLSSQLEDAFSRKHVPNWQDSSTIKSCKLMEEFVGSSKKLAEITGSKAHTRFTASQIHKFKQDQLQAYNETDRISLVSSFVTTILCGDGEIKGIDASDACGMNLLDMKQLSEDQENPSSKTSSRLEPYWNFSLLKFCSGTYTSPGTDEEALELERKLGKISFDGGVPTGTIGEYFIKRYGFNKECQVFPGTGDNPATFLSFSLSFKEAIISLGTSDTVLVSTNQFKPNEEFHAFLNPNSMVLENGIKKFGFFNMLVYKSGSLSREFIRDEYSFDNGDGDKDEDWKLFNRNVEENLLENQDGKEQNIGFYWLKPEIIPSGAYGIHRYSRSSPTKPWNKLSSDFENKSQNSASILETQFLNYRSRSSMIVGDDEEEEVKTSKKGPLNKVFAVGGASKNQVICQTMSNILNGKVCKPVILNPKAERGKLNYKIADYNSCSVAAAYKARWGWERFINQENKEIEFDLLVEKLKKELEREERNGFELSEDSFFGRRKVENGVLIVAEPDPKRAEVYDGIVEEWKKLEGRAKNGN